MHKRILAAILAVFTITVIITSCSAFSNEMPRLNVCTLSDKHAKGRFGITPKEFCVSKGEGTALYGSYTFADVDKDGNLVVKLNDEELAAWRSSEPAMHILQRILGEERYIGVETHTPEDPINAIFYDAAPTSNLIISDDYTMITASSESNRVLVPSVVGACVFMQITSGVYSDDVTVKYVELDENGDAADCLIYPDDFSDHETD